MEKSFSNSYKEAGVDVTAGYKSVELMKTHIATQSCPIVSCLFIKKANFSFVPTPSDMT